jgi:hypothetical protein
MDTPRQTTPPESDPGFDWPPYAAEGYDPPPPPPRRPGSLDFSPLFVLLDAIRRVLPGNVDEQFTRLIREALLTLRALIDWYLERLDRPRREPRVEDIPID